MRIEAADRAGRERLLRYCARPPFALDRLRELDPERLLYESTKPGPGRNASLRLMPLELIDRLGAAAARPPSRRRSASTVTATSACCRERPPTGNFHGDIDRPELAVTRLIAYASHNDPNRTSEPAESGHSYGLRSSTATSVRAIHRLTTWAHASAGTRALRRRQEWQHEGACIDARTDAGKQQKRTHELAMQKYGLGRRRSQESAPEREIESKRAHT